MATYYVDFVNGNDSNGGQGPDASNGSSTLRPWKTISKALGASGIASGDICYLAPGSFREVVTVAMTSATAETSLIGDPSNAQGFKTSGGALVAPGDVIWTGYTTDDVTAPSTTSLLTLAGRDFLTFRNLVMIGGNTDPSIINAGSGTSSTDLKLQDCVLIPAVKDGRLIRCETAAGVAANWTIDRCTIVGSAAATSGVIGIVLNRHSADYDANIQITNCAVFSMGSTPHVVRVSSAGAGAGFGGGVDVLNCTFLCGIALATNDASLSTSIPCTITGCIIYNPASTGISANTSGQITEDYNWIWATTRDTNVTDGSNSVSSTGGPPRAPLLEWGQSRISGRQTRSFLMPALGSPFLNFGVSGAPSVDILNRPRPAGSGLASTAGTGVAVGAYERHDTATQETSTVDASGSGIVIVGPGDHDLKIPVDATATTISIKARYDSTHAATNKPQVLLLANAKLGVSAQTLTMTSAADTWEMLTTSSFTPTQKGVVTLRLVSRSAGGSGRAFFDTLS